jgi:hypothetical protein
MRDEDLTRSYRRWQAAEAAGRDDDADLEFKAVFTTALPPLAASATFTAETMAAVAAAAARDARRSRRTRAATIAAGIVAAVTCAYFGAGFFVTVVVSTVTGGFNLLVGTVVRMAGAAQTGADVWSVFTGMGRAAAAFASDPTVTMMLFALQAIALGALFALQRLLGVDEESLK